jgi:hypothetical protein
MYSTSTFSAVLVQVASVPGIRVRVQVLPLVWTCLDCTLLLPLVGSTSPSDGGGVEQVPRTSRTSSRSRKACSTLSTCTAATTRSTQAHARQTHEVPRSVKRTLVQQYQYQIDKYAPRVPGTCRICYINCCASYCRVLKYTTKSNCRRKKYTASDKDRYAGRHNFCALFSSESIHVLSL